MPTPPVAYRVLARLATSLIPLATPFSAKLAAGDRARRGALDRWRAWARASRDPRRPLLWVHAPSVGEGLQANAVLKVLRPRHPDWQVVYSFFSPSAKDLGERQPVDHADFLPYDTAATMDALVNVIKARALVFTKLDLWPELATAAARVGTQVGMVAATVSPVSGRLHPLVRWLARPGYAALARVGAIDDPDGARLRTLGVPAAAVAVTGDPRFDSALERARGPLPPEGPRLTRSHPTLVAGSTWPADEDVLLAAFAAVRTTHPNARLVIVPHEPTPRHLDRLATRAARLRIPTARLSALGASDDSPCVIVDRTGILSGLYPSAAMAFVGGGFGGSGLHSVLEPAAAGVPVGFGPRWQSSREAGLLLAAKAATALPVGEAAGRELATCWRDWLDHPDERQAQGRRAVAVVEKEIGAAERGAELIERLMEA